MTHEFFMKAWMLCALLALAWAWAPFMPSLFAALIPTDELLTQATSAHARATAMLARDEVRARLQALRVDPEVVQARIDALTT